MNWIVVIDDSCRFPLHVWRYMSRALGFGIGEVGQDGRFSGSDWISKDLPLMTDDGRLVLWWVPADGAFESGIKRMLDEAPPDAALTFLVDIHGDRRSQYSAIDACRVLQDSTRKPEPVWHPVSAYYSGAKIKGREVLPKSRDMLENLRQNLYKISLGGRAGTPKSNEDPPLNILVTGAGFEMRGERGGFGLPSTKSILESMGSPFRQEADRRREDSISLNKMAGKGFPVPADGLWKVREFLDSIKGVASVEDLDQYWNILLEKERHALINSAASHDELEEQKVQALFHETGMREAFRRSILRHDWGYLSQSISAAKLDWHAWLTTNYTHFSNRAIDLAFDDDGELTPWRIVTVAEAQLMMREDAGSLDDKKERYLFKLHGDVGHLHTMAIAGHDKDISSPLSIVMELYLVYLAAQNFLVESLNRALSGSSVVWHIVGHGLQDKRLRQLLGRTTRQSNKNVNHFFVLVTPETGGPLSRLSNSLPDSTKAQDQILDCPLYASQYLARLEDRGLPKSSSPEGIREWVTQIKGA
jgi:SIR2-like domain